MNFLKILVIGLSLLNATSTASAETVSVDKQIENIVECAAKFTFETMSSGWGFRVGNGVVDTIKSVCHFEIVEAIKTRIAAGDVDDMIKSKIAVAIDMGYSKGFSNRTLSLKPEVKSLLEQIK